MKKLVLAMIFLIPLAVLNLNIGKRYNLEEIYPNLNIIDILMVFALIMLAFRRIFLGKKIKFPDNFGFKLNFMLVLYFTINLIYFTEFPEYGVLHYVSLLSGLIFFILAYNIIENDYDVKRIILVLNYSIIFQFVMVVYELITGDVNPITKIFYSNIPSVESIGLLASRRVSGTVGNGNIFGWLITYPFAFILPFAVNKLKNIKKYNRFALGAIFIFGLVTFVRSVIACQIIMVIVAASFFAAGKNYKRLIYIPVFLFMAASIYFALINFTSLSSLLQIRSQENTLSARTISWDVGFRILEEHPFTGIGAGVGSRFSHRLKAMESYYDTSEEGDTIGYAGIHNQMARLFAETGIIGFVIYISLYLWFLIKALKLFFKEKDDLNRNIIMTTILIMIYALIQDYMQVSLDFKQSSIYLGLNFALFSYYLHKKKENSIHETNSVPTA